MAGSCLQLSAPCTPILPFDLQILSWSSHIPCPVAARLSLLAGVLVHWGGISCVGQLLSRLGCEVGYLAVHSGTAQVPAAQP